MKTSSVLRATALATGLLAAATASQAVTPASNCDALSGNLVTNCGFEAATPDLTGWTVTGYDATAGTLGSVYGAETGIDPDNIAPHSGDNQAYFGNLVGNPLTLTQTIATTIGASYTVSFYAAQDTTPPSTADFNSNILSASFAGVTGVNLTKVAMEGYTLYSFTAVATSTSSTLNITLGNDNGQFLLDDVSVVGPAVSPVPEPNPALLLSAGLGVIGLLRSRRR